MSNAPIAEFQGPYRFLSNFWPAPVYLDNIRYLTVEHAYQAAKTLDRPTRIYIGAAPTPASAKRRAKEIPPEHLRRNWRSVQIDIMRDLLHQKFAIDTDLGRQLVATGDRELIEGNVWGDTFWGVCNGRGQNNLGKLLMEIRRELIS